MKWMDEKSPSLPPYLDKTCKQLSHSTPLVYKSKTIKISFRFYKVLYKLLINDGNFGWNTHMDDQNNMLLLH